jgi:hypothetical protein
LLLAPAFAILADAIYRENTKANPAAPKDDQDGST